MEFEAAADELYGVLPAEFTATRKRLAGELPREDARRLTALRRPTVPAWAVTEVVEHTQHALGRRLVRFGVSLTPATLTTQLEHLARALVPAVPLEPTAARLVTRSAAALVAITCARLDVTPSVTAVRELCTRPGRLVRTPDALHVIIPIAHAEIGHRRAGLDHDPGHVAWLKRKVRIELAGATTL